MMPLLKFVFILSVLIENVHLNPSRLKTDLLMNYDATVRPVLNHQNVTRVTVSMVLKYFQLDVHMSTLSIDTWMSLTWIDEHLKWKPEDYSSVKFIHMSTNEIWIPDLSVYNRNDQSGSPAIVDSTNCVVNYNGIVTCVPPSRQNSLCVPDLTKYPFDTQNCTVRIGSWVHSGEEIDFRLGKPAINTDDLLPNGDWKLIHYKVIKHDGKYDCCPNNTYPSLNYSFYMQRLSGAHTASIILPAIVLMVITLTCLGINPNNSSRISLCCVNLLCHFLYMEDLSWTIPVDGENVPLIVCFGRDSMLLASFALVFTVILQNMVKNSDKQCPGWISSVVSAAISTIPGQLILLSDNSAKGVASAKKEEDSAIIVVNTEVNSGEQDWIIFAKFLDILCFVIYIIVYFVMIISFTP